MILALLFLGATLPAGTVVRFHSGEIALPDAVQAHPGGEGRTLALAVTRHAPDARWLGHQGIPVLGALPDRVYLVWLDARQWANLAVQPDLRALVPLEVPWKKGPLHPGGSYRCLVVVESPSPHLETRHVTLRAGQLEPFLRRRDVAYIESATPLALRNDTTNWVAQSNQEGITPLHDHGLTGWGEVIGHIDGPLWIESCYFSDPDHPVGPDHRKIVGYRSQTGYGKDGHGTHTASTAAGYAAGEPNNGIAYNARLSHASFYDIEGWNNTASNLYDAFSDAHDDGARVHTNSWGEDAYRTYTTFCHDVDRFMHEHPEALVVFSVTNASDLRSPENAKNCLAVGGTYQAPQQDYICTGGRGPTLDGRLKPELFVPGCGIRSASSVQPCGTTSMSGTSMASPAVSGIAALVREYFRRGYYPGGSPDPSNGFTPSGALLKAALISAGQDMADAQGHPNFSEGWGRLQADKVLRFPQSAHALWVQDTPAERGISEGETVDYTLTVQNGTVPLRVTLAWTDYPGLPLGTARWLINDLDLSVIAPDGRVYPGNAFQNGASIPEGTDGAEADRLNTVEAVILLAPVEGIYTIRVRGAEVPMPAQGFALVATGHLAAIPYYYLPAVARVEGVNDSLWRTDLWLFNPGATSQEVTVQFVPSGEMTAVSAVVPLEPREALILDDPLQSLFAMDRGVGAFKVWGSGPLEITARLFNSASGATYGQGYPAFDETYAAGDTVYLPGLFVDADRRTNLGFATFNAEPWGSYWVQATLRLYDADGALLASTNLSLPPRWHEQNTLGAYFPAVGTLHNGTLAVTVTGLKGLFPYASVATNSTSDGLFVAPRKATQDRWVVPALASAPNPTGYPWKTEFSLFSPQGGPFSGTFRYTDGTEWNDHPVSLALPALGSAYFDDFLRGQALGDGVGYLVFEGPFVPVTRVWSGATQAESMGQSIPALDQDQAATHHWLPGYLPGTAFRLNLGLENLGAGDAYCQAVLWSAGHEKIGESILGSPARQLIQQNAMTLFGTLPVGEAGVIELACDRPVLAYVSLVDGTTSDATFFSD